MVAVEVAALIVSQVIMREEGEVGDVHEQIAVQVGARDPTLEARPARVSLGNAELQPAGLVPVEN